MAPKFMHPPKARRGEKVAVVSPPFAAPGMAPVVHEQAMRYLSEITGLVPVESEDFGKDWTDPAALNDYGERETTEAWAWAGPARTVTGPTWGGCAEVLQWILTAGRFPPDPAVLDGAVLVVEASEEIIPTREFGWIPRSSMSGDC